MTLKNRSGSPEDLDSVLGKRIKGEIWSMFSGLIKENVRNLLDFGQLFTAFDVNSPACGKAGRLVNGEGDRFKLEVPFCCGIKKWEVICNEHEERLIPDFILDEKSFIPCLREVNNATMAGGGFVLLDSLLHILEQYRMFQLASVMGKLEDGEAKKMIEELMGAAGKEYVAMDGPAIREGAGAIEASVRIDCDSEGNIVEKHCLVDRTKGVYSSYLNIKMIVTNLNPPIEVCSLLLFYRNFGKNDVYVMLMVYAVSGMLNC